MQSGVQYPNKIFVADFVNKAELGFKDYNIRYIIVIAAKDIDTAVDFLDAQFNIKPALTYIVNAGHQTLYDQTGNKPLNVQAKILYFSHTQVK
jgi:hypothetical protein